MNFVEKNVGVKIIWFTLQTGLLVGGEGVSADGSFADFLKKEKRVFFCTFTCACALGGIFKEKPQAQETGVWDPEFLLFREIWIQIAFCFLKKTSGKRKKQKGGHKLNRTCEMLF